MDPQAYLMSQGWSGPGNPLNPARRPGSHGGLGLTKPILVARKRNTHGVGKKTTHDHTNQWWLRGFEEALRGIGTDGSSTRPIVNSTAPTPTSELYKFFVRGQGLAGTITHQRENETQRLPSSSSKSSIAPTKIESLDEKKKKKRKREERTEETLANDLNTQLKKKKHKRSKTKCDDLDETPSCSPSGIATPPNEEDSKSHIDDKVSEKRKRKEGKRKREKHAEELLELKSSGASDEMSTKDDSQKRGKDMKKAAKTTPQGESGEKNKSTKKSKKDKTKSNK